MIPNHYNMKTWLVFSCHMNSKTNVFQYKFDIHFKRLIGFQKKKKARLKTAISIKKAQVALTDCFVEI